MLPEALSAECVVLVLHELYCCTALYLTEYTVFRGVGEGCGGERERGVMKERERERKRERKKEKEEKGRKRGKRRECD